VVTVYGVGAGQFLQDNVRRDVFATLYENAGQSNQPPQAQDSESIFYTLGSSPPGGGVATLGSGPGAPGYFSPPQLTNVVIAGSTLIPENSETNFTATSYFNNGLTDTNMTPQWSSSTFTIAANGKFSAGAVSADTPVTIAGAITYGNAVTGTIAATVVNVQTANLTALGQTNRQFQFKLTGTTGRRYAIESLTNLTAPTWRTVLTNQIASNSTSILLDPLPATNRTKLYRSREL
jgi:hypothetical protein